MIYPSIRLNLISYRIFRYLANPNIIRSVFSLELFLVTNHWEPVQFSVTPRLIYPYMTIRDIRLYFDMMLVIKVPYIKSFALMLMTA